MTEHIRSNFVRLLKTPAFIVVGLILLGSAVGMNVATSALGLYFKKEAVELRTKLDRLPSKIGPWVQVTNDQVFSVEIEHALGTKDYISRWYVDTRRVDPKELAGINKMTTAQRHEVLGKAMQKDPAAVLDLHMAYYTGLADTVAHVPERCFIGGGFDVNQKETIQLGNLSTLEGGNPLKASYLEFQDRERANYPKQNVAYFFQVNGAYESDATVGVRTRLQDIREKFAYYCKVEMRMMLNDKSELAKKQFADFVSFALPEIEKALPDWQAVKSAGK